MNILDFFLPKFCVLCSKRDDYICNDCIRQFVFTLPSCCICKKLSNRYLCHKECVGKEIQVYTCWYIDKIFQRTFNKQDKYIQQEIIEILQTSAQQRFNTKNPFIFSTEGIDINNLISEASPHYFLFTPAKN